MLSLFVEHLDRVFADQCPDDFGECKSRRATERRGRLAGNRELLHWTLIQLMLPGLRESANKGIYRGIDLVFHGEAGLLAYDFIVAPHADPSFIRLELTGQRSLRVGDDGGLIVST
jgi:hypothetical protein